MYVVTWFLKLILFYILTCRYDTRQSSTKIPNPPRWWSSPMGFGDRAYFHTVDSERLQHDQNYIVDHMTVDRAIATDTGIYRCRIDFLKAPTRNRLVNLTVIGNLKGRNKRIMTYVFSFTLINDLVVTFLKFCEIK